MQKRFQFRILIITILAISVLVLGYLCSTYFWGNPIYHEAAKIAAENMAYKFYNTKFKVISIRYNRGEEKFFVKLVNDAGVEFSTNVYFYDPETGQEALSLDSFGNY
jgi:archaellum component FlaF (FlaF/FlaG flagellin family)